ncbi:MAG: hypothetical protein NZ480_04845 [Bdellovibrionaceae bacterium]|nr:hypothetical protein [Pseudobdellovibrionaceae bacterium]MDW8189730.1 hypothetical protein [Pseudobdellovibrionaceae bacterium]
MGIGSRSATKGLRLSVGVQIPKDRNNLAFGRDPLNMSHLNVTLRFLSLAEISGQYFGFVMMEEVHRVRVTRGRINLSLGDIHLPVTSGDNYGLKIRWFQDTLADQIESV